LQPRGQHVFDGGILIRFLHSADLHLGKPFGRLPEDVRARLRVARDGVVARLVRAARDGGASHVLLAGDSFDAETPPPRLLRQAMNAMAAATELTWVILPGNHDSLAATELWANMARALPPNVQLALTPAPLPLGQAVLLAAPCTARRPGLDLTTDLDQATASGLIRIGLAHGAITDFAGAGSEDGNPAVIPPDRAQRSGLDYLALGDWHGQMAVGPRCWYAGTPERDSFRHPGPGAVLLVQIDGPGAPPQVTPMVTGSIEWQARTLDLLPGEDGAARLAGLLPGRDARSATLLRLAMQGRADLAQAQALRAALADLAHDLLHLDLDDALQPQIAPGDLDQIDRAGALRQAAEALAATLTDPAATPARRQTAGAALSRLFAFVAEG